jgi:hypothetical protein
MSVIDFLESIYTNIYSTFQFYSNSLVTTAIYVLNLFLMASELRLLLGYLVQYYVIYYPHLRNRFLVSIFCCVSCSVEMEKILSR